MLAGAEKMTTKRIGLAMKRSRQSSLQKQNIAPDRTQENCESIPTGTPHTGSVIPGTPGTWVAM
jgi:hypothetical protein